MGAICVGMVSLVFVCDHTMNTGSQHACGVTVCGHHSTSPPTPVGRPDARRPHKSTAAWFTAPINVT